jgi:hypothetical protein
MRTRGCARWPGATLAALAIAIGGCGSDDDAIDAAIATIDAAGGIDAGAGGIDAIELGPVQCRVSEDCIPLTGSGCFQSRPGGICTDCGEAGDSCPDDTVCITGGTSGGTECAYPCTGDEDCNIGMYCATIGESGTFCQPRLCGEGLPPCPYPYTFCRETTAPLFECARPRCQDGCPPPLSCGDNGTGFCLEP